MGCRCEIIIAAMAQQPPLLQLLVLAIACAVSSLPANLNSTVTLNMAVMPQHNPKGFEMWEKACDHCYETEYCGLEMKAGCYAGKCSDFIGISGHVGEMWCWTCQGDRDHSKCDGPIPADAIKKKSDPIFDPVSGEYKSPYDPSWKRDSNGQ